jgi:hypothetical protein
LCPKSLITKPPSFYLGEEVDDAEFEKEIDFDVDSIKIDPLPQSSVSVQTFIGW